MIDFYVNPDTLYNVDAYVDGAEFYTFMYGERLGFHWDGGDVSHRDILRNIDAELDRQISDLDDHLDLELLTRYRYIDKLYGLLNSDLDEAQQHMLMGRSGPLNIIPGIGAEEDNTTYLVAFWNDDPAVYARLLPECMIKLYDNNLIRDPVLISTPNWGTRDYSSGETQRIARDPTPNVNKKDLERMRRLHLMRADEKKKAMQELGLATASQKHPMQAALEKSGHINPGQKWWALTSESFARKLSMILRGL